ncbi:hypothetical protein ACJJTC_004225 [Scirpophaga incertulas]
MLGRIVPGAGTQVVAVINHQQNRNMATLKAISIRLKSVKNIQKITQSMKMVSAAKYTRAERDLKAARPYGEGAVQFYERAEVTAPEDDPKQLYVAMTSDRGLCERTCITVRVQGDPQPPERTICAGKRQRSQLWTVRRRSHRRVQGDPQPLMSPERTTSSQKAVENAPKLTVYDSLDADVVQSYMEFSLTSMVFYALKEGACSEQSSRMTAMDNASKNAGEMIDKLTLTFNRTRQAVITRELIEIISGAAALD